jgi:hypothetical protein
MKSKIHKFPNLKINSMSKTKLLFALTLIATMTKAQDIITRNDSSKTQANILEISQEEIRYKLFGYSDGPIITTLKSEIAYVKFRNGAIEVFTKYSAPATTEHYDPYNFGQPITGNLSNEKRIKKCEKLYKYDNYLGFNYAAFLNTTIGFNYMHDFKKANLILNIPFAFGLGNPSITNSMYGSNYLGVGFSNTKYTQLDYQVGIGTLFAPSLTHEVNFLMGPSLSFSQFQMSTKTTYNTGGYTYSNPANYESYNNNFTLYRKHFGINVGFLARFSERINMNMLLTFGYKKDSYNQKDPYGIDFINSHAYNKISAPEDNVMPYVNYSMSIGYRF